ncbi:hypothetical protein [Enterococcus faecalis]|jgi:hypothetical protein|uniref:hypothetical protein n=1 Tax=Enterococcus faecalis TaxID=1351 RepID=UPI0020580FA6|nr:hypothetical protein [Enterococcus faecalis]BDH63984.1 hypothetical protein MTP05_01690 [Enterococcus sp. PLM3]
MKRKTKNFCIIVVVCAVVVVLGYSLYSHHEKREQEAKENEIPVFTKDHPNNLQIRYMVNKLYMISDPSLRKISLLESESHKNMTLKVTENTNKAIVVLNYYRFDDLDEFDKEGYKKAVEYGFSKNNRITVDWVMNHKKRTFTIMYNMFDHGHVFEDKELILKRYDQVKVNLNFKRNE